jgi:hypothetical protein
MKKNKKQNIIARSSVKIEYWAMASTISDLTQKQMKMYYDNLVALHIASNLMFHERTKYIKVDRHFVWKKLQAKKIETPFIRSNNQLTDILTKKLESKLFEINLNKSELINIYNPNLRENVEN